MNGSNPQESPTPSSQDHTGHCPNYAYYHIQHPNKDHKCGVGPPSGNSSQGYIPDPDEPYSDFADNSQYGKHIDRGKGFTHHPNDDCDPRDSSLREQITGTVLRPLADKFQELTRQIDSGEYELPKTIKQAEAITENYINQAYERVEKIVTTYIEAAEIDRALLELELARESGGLRAGYYRGRKERLQAQKAVLDKGEV